ncbi:1,6-anhydro-N-acetylmuramyl-L-alanine amidase AmpD [Venatoribacter cucullus]|uniref:1,6-anhydro-N-acetylmuramyl-L-alanine amidase AmpD n=1 Tax=Venatoribacter cucullus TaxID=2661630 RepID=UPI00223EB895|nr:1,6-anhydro-N-acetylmuramyl-L-alanine amidase AmpD [Venatoribacter cucullus]UZK04283.1 1,6-anhydro-N-acetylmuramyl-L-alanine amidase AmpD [Venatoribacter cucullus]
MNPLPGTLSFSVTDGWLQPARHCPSPNFGPRPAGQAGEISLLVLHNISLPPGQFGGGYVQRFFCNQLNKDEHPYFAEIAGLQVSSHLFIERDGAITQFVSFADRAWHAGRSCYGGRSECNDFSIGIELEGTDTLPYSDQQYNVLAALLPALRAEYPALVPSRITGHEQIAPGRKTDPGNAFDWQRLFVSLCQTRA